MNMIPFHHIEKPNYLVIQFGSYRNILMLENYCSDPDCDCDEALLNFIQLTEDHKILNNLINIKVNLNTGEIIDHTVLEPSINTEEIMTKFQQHFYQFKDHLNENNQKVKMYYSTFHDQQLPGDVIQLINGNNCVNYQKLFGDINQMTIDYLDENYLIEDQYCMKPSCLCDEVILVVYKPNASISELIFRLDLKNNNYEVLKINTNKDHVRLIKWITEQKLSILQARYNRMKEVGKQFLA